MNDPASDPSARSCSNCACMDDIDSSKGIMSECGHELWTLRLRLPSYFSYHFYVCWIPRNCLDVRDPEEREENENAVREP